MDDLDQPRPVFPRQSGPCSHPPRQRPIELDLLHCGVEAGHSSDESRSVAPVRRQCLPQRVADGFRRLEEGGGTRCAGCWNGSLASNMDRWRPWECSGGVRLRCQSIQIEGISQRPEYPLVRGRDVVLQYCPQSDAELADGRVLSRRGRSEEVEPVVSWALLFSLW